MITVYPYVDPIIKDLGDGWGQIDMYFFDDNDYGSYIQGVGDNTGGQMVYCSIKFYHYAPPSTDPSNPEAESLLNIHNAPNPFFSETQIQFSTSVGVENAKVAIYNIRGQLIKTIDPVTESHTEGHATWDGTDQNGNNVTNGIYFYRVETNGASIAKKMIVIK